MSLYRRLLLIRATEKKEKKEDVVGKPEVEKDDSGQVVSYENTEELTVSSANTEINTEFVPFDGKDWELHIYAHFKYSEQTSTYPTLLCCMQSSSPWPGITIRYEDSQLYCVFNDGAGNKHYYKLSADSSGNVDITITYVSDVVNATNNSTKFMTNVSMSSMSLESLELTLMADSNPSNRRYGIGTIYEFYIKKT